MTMIKKFSEFIKEEAISGTEFGIDGSFGPGSPASSVPNTINYNDTKTILASNNKFYTKDDFIDLLQKFLLDFKTEYQDYINNGGKPLDDFNEYNIDMILHLIKNANNIEHQSTPQ
jgi:hypothetical protein